VGFYLIEELQQGSSEWHAWRRGVIGASDASTIMGENRFKSRSYLIKEKLGQVREFQGNAKTREGQNLEGVARDDLAKKFSLKLKPVVAQDAQVPYLAASIDAMCADHKEVFEIKAGLKTYEHTLASQNVPGYYLAQLQHILMVTKKESMIFAAYRPGQNLITVRIPRDEKYISRLRELEVSFVNDLVHRGHEAQFQFRGRLVG
jgi:putative phage-type endonuclease